MALDNPLAHVRRSGESMSYGKSNEEGFTGLEAAIVLIAFIVVAAVFSYVVLGAGFFTTQKAQETVYRGVEQSTTNVQLVGHVYGLASNTAEGIDQIRFTIGLVPGTPSVNLEKMNIMVSTPTFGPKTFAWTSEFVHKRHEFHCFKKWCRHLSIGHDFWRPGGNTI